MVKKGVISAFAAIGYGLVFVVSVIIVAVLVQIGIFGLGEKDEPIVGLEISSSKTVEMQNAAGDVVGTLDLTVRSTLSGKLALTMTTPQQTHLVVKIGSNLLVYQNISDVSNYEFTYSYQSLTMPICAILTNGETVYAHGQTDNFSDDYNLLVAEYRNYVENGGTTPTDTNSRELNVSTSNTSELLSFNLLGNANLDTGSVVESSSLEVTFTIRRSSSSQSEVLPVDERPVQFVVTDENGNPILDNDGNIQTTESITIGINDAFVLALSTYTATNPYIEGAEEQTYIKGGTGYLHARSTDNLWQASSIRINVDVPVESLEIEVYGYDKNGQANQNLTEIINDTLNVYTEYTEMPAADVSLLGTGGKYIGETTDYFENGKYYEVVEEQGAYYWHKTDMQYFIQNDELTLRAVAFPANSLESASNMKKTVNFSSIFSDVFASLSSDGNLCINGASSETTGGLEITATVNTNFGGLQETAAQITVWSAPLEIESITINNESLKNDDGEAVLNAYVNEEMWVSATETEDATNLDVIVRSKHYTHGDDPSQQNISSLIMYYTHNHNNEAGYEDGIDVSNLNSSVIRSLVTNGNTPPYMMIKDEDTLDNSLWQISPTRQLLTGEEIHIYISDANFYDYDAESFYWNRPYVELKININIRTPSNFSYASTNETIDITKYDSMVGTNNIQPYDLTNFISYTGDITYTKWVYFMDDMSANVNAVGSQIIEVTDTGQIFSSVDGQLSQMISPVGAGTVTIRAFLVRTNAEGEPIDARYNVIESLENAGYVLKTNADINDDSQIGQFVVEYSPNVSFTLNVNEVLTELKFFYDEDLTLEITNNTQSTPIKMGTGQNNEKNVYFIANSKMALINYFEQLGFTTNNNRISLSDSITYNMAGDGGETGGTGEDVENVETGDTEDNVISNAVAQVTLATGSVTDFTLQISNGEASLAELYFDAINVIIENLKVDWGDLKVVQDVDGVQTIYAYSEVSEVDRYNINWYFAEDSTQTSGGALAFNLPNTLTYEYNLAGEEEGNDPQPFNNLVYNYKVYELTDEQLEIVKQSAEIDWSKYTESSSIRISNSQNGLMMQLFDGWQNITNNIIIVYTSSIYLEEDEYSIKYDYYNLIINNENYVSFRQVNNSIPPLTYTENYPNATSNGFLVLHRPNSDTYVWQIHYNGDTSVDNGINLVNNGKLTATVPEYFVIDSQFGYLKIATGYSYSKDNSNISSDSIVLQRNGRFSITYQISTNSSVVYQHSITVTSEIYIYQE